MSNLKHYTIVINDETCDDDAIGDTPEEALELYLDELGDATAYYTNSSVDEIILTDNETGESWRMSGECHVHVEHDWVAELQS